MKKEERFNRYKYLTGLSAWEIASYQDPDNIVVLNDGPSGLRKPTKNGFNEQNEIIKTVCMPTPSALAASFEQEVAYASGELIAKECLHHHTNILLAPGVNIKRYVMCGRNFEYFSEDPYLAGLLAASYVNGLEDNGVGACVKHYACNSQEHGRTVNSSEVSLRALNEIYLRVFKYTLAYSNPTSIMTSYNKINGTYVNESKYLIQDKLRKEYGFKGLIMSDWCAVSHKGKTFNTGLNIEMPLTKMSNEYIDREYNKSFTDEDLIKLDDQIYNTVKKFKDKKSLCDLDLDKLHQQAVNVANKSMVLVKNEDYLPLNPTDKILVLGYFANHARFVGKGSGWVNAYQDTTVLDVLNKNNINYDFLECYDEEKVTTTIEELKKYQGKYDKVLLFLGQYEHDESEGYDRMTIDLRGQQIEVLKMVKETFETFATVLVSGSVVNVKEVYDLSSAMMITYLAGEGQSEAIYNNLFALVNPSGRLPETWISSLKQNPINDEYARRDIYHTYYHDDIYVGYRYYDMHQNGFILPFGYGLSYSKFKYDDFGYEVVNNEKIIISLKINNLSDIDGEDVIQVYIGKKESNIYRPIKELKGFKKFMVPAQSEIKAQMEILIEDLKSYRDLTDSFELEDGSYQIYLAKNTQDIIDMKTVNLKGIIFEEQLTPKKLDIKAIPSLYTLDSPAGILFENELFKKYVIENNLPIDLKDFEKRYFYIDSKALRVTIFDGDFQITFEQMEALIDYLNKNTLKMNMAINFDENVRKYRGL